MITRETISDWGKELGFATMGVISPEHALALPFRPQWRPSFAPGSIVVMSYPSFEWRDRSNVEPMDGETVTADVVGWYIASNEAHARSCELVERLIAAGSQAERLSPVRAKTAALYAGLGVYRMNTLLYTPAHGSYQAIQIIAVSDNLERDEPTPCGNPEHADMEAHCPTCRRCVQACPTGALDGKGWIDINKCLRTHMFSGKPIPVEYRRLMGHRLIGCDICQRVCPKEPAVLPLRDKEDWPWLKLSELLNAAPETIDALSYAIGANYAKTGRVQAQAAIIAGNACLSEFKPALMKIITSEDETAREHAQWALDRIRYGCPE